MRDKSALSVHVRVCGGDDIVDFHVKILECVKRSLDIVLLEARLIRRSRPMLNRCDELSDWLEVRTTVYLITCTSLLIALVDKGSGPETSEL